MAQMSALYSNVPASLFGLFLAWLVGGWVYNIFLHPLRKFPGPRIRAASRMPHFIRVARGRNPMYMLELHKRYGPVVRIAPNELSFHHPSAWNDIQGHKTNGQLELDKFNLFYHPVEGLEPDIVTSNRQYNSMIRKVLASSFSEKALRDQEPLIGRYIDLFVERLRELAAAPDQKGPVDMTSWFNFATFDIIGDLSFGEPFGCLESAKYHPWVTFLFFFASWGSYAQQLAQFTLSKMAMDLVGPFVIHRILNFYLGLAGGMLERRMMLEKERSDIVDALLRKKEQWDFSMDRLRANTSMIILAGSETTATSLAGTTFLLLQNPQALKKVTEEVRSAFSSESEINFTTSSTLPYLGACLNEGMRIYPAVAIGIPRVVPRGGAQICGHYVPEKSLVAVHHYAMYHDDAFWEQPEAFRPERFLEAAAGEDGDKLEAFQPFHVGPRACLGKGLARVEMRTILARLLYSFDLSIARESDGWLAKQRCYNLWEKGPLNVHLTPVERKVPT